MKPPRLTPNTERIQQDIDTLATFVDESKPGWTRRPFTPSYAQGRKWLQQQMVECALDVRQDATANLIGTIRGSEDAPPIVIGSHIDTVVGGGRYDGIIGVLAGLEMARLFQESGIQLRHPVEVVDFTAEEPSDFGISTIGSRGMVNNLPTNMLKRQDPTGLTLQEAIQQAGGNPDKIPETARRKGDIAVYVELHIEQGPVLEQTGDKLGVVTGIVGIHRYRVTVDGSPNHAGTTPMAMRNDALSGAAEILLTLERICQETDGQAVGTVGKLNVLPNSSNVIPGQVVFDLEVRAIDEGMIERVISDVSVQAEAIVGRRELNVRWDCLSKSAAIKVSDSVRDVIEQACTMTGATRQLPSGAGHDANQLAKIAPIGMIFVPSKGGRSHCPEEWTSTDDIAMGVEALTRAVLLFDERL